MEKHKGNGIDPEIIDPSEEAAVEGELEADCPECDHPNVVEVEDPTWRVHFQCENCPCKFDMEFRPEPPDEPGRCWGLAQWLVREGYPPLKMAVTLGPQGCGTR